METTRNVYYSSHSVYIFSAIVSINPPIYIVIIENTLPHLKEIIQQLSEFNESPVHIRSITGAPTQGTLVGRQPLKTLYTQMMTTSECVDVGNLLETHGAFSEILVVIVAVRGISLARGDAGGTTGSDSLTEHLGRMNGFRVLDFHLGSEQRNTRVQRLRECQGQHTQHGETAVDQLLFGLEETLDVPLIIGVHGSSEEGQGTHRDGETHVLV